MNNEQMISCLEFMAERIAEYFGNGEGTDVRIDAQLAQSYAQICTAITALNAPKPFLQIGKDILRKEDIVRVEILEETRYRTDGSVMHPKSIQVYTRDLDGAEDHGSWNTWRNYVYHSPEGQALLGWLQGQSEVLLAYGESAQPDCNACSEGQCDLH